MGINGMSDNIDSTPYIEQLLQRLSFLFQPQHQIVLKALCAEAKSEYKGLSFDGFGIYLVGTPGEPLENRQIQLQTLLNGYNLGTWKDNLQGLAEALAEDGVTPRQLEKLAQLVQNRSSLIDQPRDHAA